MNQLLMENKKQTRNDQLHAININVVVNLQQANLNLQVSIDPEMPFNLFTNGILEQIVAQKIQAQYAETIEWQLGNGPNLQLNESRTLQTLGFKNNCTLYVRLKLKSAPHFKQGEKRKFKVLVDLKFEKMELFIEQFETNPVSCIFHDILIKLFNNQKLKIDHPFAFFINETEIEPFDTRSIENFNTNKGIIVKTILPNKQTNQDSIEKYKFALNSSKQIKPNLKQIIKIQFNNKMEMFAQNDTSLEDILQKMQEDLKISNIYQNRAKKYYINDVELFELKNFYPIDNIKVDIQSLNENDIVFKIIGDFNIKINLYVGIIHKEWKQFYQIDELKPMNTSMTEFLQYLKFKIFGPNQINYKQQISQIKFDKVMIIFEIQ